MNSRFFWGAAAGLVGLMACSSSTPAPTPAPLPGNDAPAPLASTSDAPTLSASAPALSAMPVASAIPTIPADPPEAALPPGFVHVDDEGSTRCGSLTIERPSEPDSAGQRFVRVLRGDGKPAYEAHGRRYKLDPAEKGQGPRMEMSVEFCGDLTGDGVPELVLTERTMGAHCCYTHYVVSMTTPSKRLLFWEKGDLGVPVVPVRYNPDGPWQLQSSVVFWPPFKTAEDDPPLSYASAPVVPVVFSMQAGEYQLTSLSFPEAYRRDRGAIEASCVGKEFCGGEMIAWLDSLAIGDWKSVRENPMFKGLLPVYDRREAATRRELLKMLGSKASPAKLTAR